MPFSDFPTNFRDFPIEPGEIALDDRLAPFCPNFNDSVIERMIVRLHFVQIFMLF
jgi:hypothetical protein